VTTSSGGGTVRAALLLALSDAARFNVNDQSAPIAVLWADPNREWAGVIPQLANDVPILTLGAYAPSKRTGPAIWLRCAIEGALGDLEGGAVPAAPHPTILYLPGIDSNTLRSAANVPKELEPLVELRYRGVAFRHPNGRDWTARGFITSCAGVQVREDQETSNALHAALEVILELPVATLARKGVLDASFFHQLITPDAVRELLHWMNADDAEVATLKGDGSRWRTFRAVTKGTYGIDPERDGQLSAAERILAAAETPSDPWNDVWSRFREAPQRYPRLPDLLQRASSGQGSLFAASERSPADNERAEGELRGALQGLMSLPLNKAREALRSLVSAHGPRSGWVWADLGQAPLATALGPLLKLLEHTSEPLGAGTPSEIAGRYADRGWRADRAALHALQSGHDVATSKALGIAVAAVYRPWLDEAASAFQQAVANHGLPAPQAPIGPKSGALVLFTDGLRFDIANDLAALLRDNGRSVTLEHQFGPVPGITASAKPAVSPARANLRAGAEFNATYEGTAVTASVLRRAIAAAGFEVLSSDSTGDANGAGWTEYGNLDAIGHAEGARLAQRVDEQVRALAARVGDLITAGWREVTVITDHGWLLLPGGLPSVSLPQHLTEARKGRCARLKDGASVDYQSVPWTFDPEVSIALAPGIAVFVSGNEYEHGGLSPQESVLPVLRIRAGSHAGDSDLATWGDVTWTGLRVRAEVHGAPPGAQLDLRTKANDPSTSVAKEPKKIGADGKVALVVPNDEHEGTAAILVVLDAAERVLLQRPTVVADR
jgi:hypothetical protein